MSALARDGGSSALGAPGAARPLSPRSSASPLPSAPPVSAWRYVSAASAARGGVGVAGSAAEPCKLAAIVQDLAETGQASACEARILLR